jgi:hypothetical protein
MSRREGIARLRPADHSILSMLVSGVLSVAYSPRLPTRILTAAAYILYQVQNRVTCCPDIFKCMHQSENGVLSLRSALSHNGTCVSSAAI